jgi:hypothetical protein
MDGQNPRFTKPFSESAKKQEQAKTAKVKNRLVKRQAI